MEFLLPILQSIAANSKPCLEVAITLSSPPAAALHPRTDYFVFTTRSGATPPNRLLCLRHPQRRYTPEQTTLRLSSTNRSPPAQTGSWRCSSSASAHHTAGPTLHVTQLAQHYTSHSWPNITRHTAGPTLHVTQLAQHYTSHSWPNITRHTAGPTLHVTQLAQHDRQRNNWQRNKQQLRG